ncbi:hypothetical protein [Siphonobacter sp. SORGH_AS_1065]|uniref:hypothetical protein n=1 Tax=Siphonobacter sp. SORGH_AS_1065 TaxID=3041795 RepID=UPI00277D1BA0|nr:hypothetical protein [Siphonobacter sp. SORGH_AS_1065]MDQ1089433.1 hypothetical protein [Siphonobacter sp. SORGH_AS_1065]
MINEILSTLGLIGLGFVFGKMLPSYFSKKGENLATKEDITEITHLIESTRNVFLIENEKLRFNLNISSNLQLGVALEARKSIVEFNEKLYVVQSMTLNIYTYINNMLDINEINRVAIIVKDNYNELSVFESRFRLFVTDEDLRNDAYIIKQYLFDEALPLVVSFLEKLRAYTNTSKYNNLTEKEIDLIKGYNIKSSIKQVEFVTKMDNFQKKCRNYMLNNK